MQNLSALTNRFNPIYNTFSVLTTCLSLVIAALVFPCQGASPPPAVTVRPGTPDSEGRPVFRLDWIAISNAFYQIQTRESLDPAVPWRTVDLVTTNGTRGDFRVEPEKVETNSESVRMQFFRLIAPQPEIFRVEPAVGPTSGGTLFLIGQCLDTNGQLRIGGVVLSPQILQPGSLYRFDMPPLAEGNYDVEWLENGQVVAAKYKLFSVTAEVQPVGIAQRLLEVPEDPPASPFPTESGANRQYVGTVTIVKRSIPTSANDPDVACGDSIALMPSGEVQLQAVDLAIPGRGLDFKWVRTYRSRTGRPTPMGNNWDHDYNLFVQRDAGGFAVFDGTGRRDLYFPGTNGAFGVHSRNESFNEVVEMPGSGFVIVKFPSMGEWVFNRLDGTPTGGKISLMVDRNSNRLLFNYDAQGRLIQITDTHGRTNRVEYNAQGFIQSVTDFTGRAVTYTYHDLGSLGGTAGDLATFTTPPVTGTPNTNDFPAGKTTSYTYSNGFGDERENHLLLTITDPKGQTPYRFVYQHNQTDLEFLRVRSFQRGNSNNVTFISYLPQIPSPTNRFAVMKTIVNDPLGNVTETWYDSQNRHIIHRDLSARSTAGLPVTETENRPTKKVRDADPEFWETHYEWNLDSLLTRVAMPRGNIQRFVYERDFDPNVSARKKGDLRVLREQACCADLSGDGLPDLVTRFEYHPNFGSPATKLSRGRHISHFRTWAKNEGSRKGWDGTIKGNPRPGEARFASGPRQTTSQEGTLVTRVIDPRGNSDLFTYDAQGNVLQHSGRLLDGQDRPVENFEYNAFGQITVQVHAGNGDGHRRQDENFYYQTGPQMGYRSHTSIDKMDPLLRTTNHFEYDAVGNVTRTIDPRGFDTVYIYNSLNQVVKKDQEHVRALDGNPSLRIAAFFVYDANDNIISADLENRNESGLLDPNNPTWETVAQYDQLNRMRLIGHELTHVVQQGIHRFATNRFDYDGNDNLVRAHSPEAVNGNDTNNIVTFEYDTRDLLFQRFRAPGTADQSVERWDYTPNGSKSTQWEPHKSPGLNSPEVPRTTYVYDGFDRCVRMRDAMGNEAQLTYDANGNVRSQITFGALEDLLATPDGNVRLAETRYDWDGHDRLVRSRVSWFDIFTEASIGDGESTTQFRYAANGQLISETDDNGNTTQYFYDTLNRLSSIADAKTNTVIYGYDANGNVISQTEVDRSDLGGPEQRFSTTWDFDGLNRMTRSSNNVGNTISYAYDSRGNVLSEVDPRGNETAFTYDGINRLVQTDFYQGLRSGGITINTTHLEYDSQRLISETDHNGNMTQYFYDSLDRHVRKRHADGTETTISYDERDNILQSTDPNGTVVRNSYDLLNRCIAKGITVGAGVANTTTAETFTYDGESRLVMASNNIVAHRFIWDSRADLPQQSSGALTVRSTFDGVGNRLSVAYPGGVVVQNNYDALNRSATLNVSASPGGSVSLIANFAYEGPDRLVRIARTNGINTRINFEGITGVPIARSFGWKQVSRINHARAAGGPVIDQRVFTYDRAQNKTERAMTTGFTQGGPTVTNQFGYDRLHRLTRAIKSRGPTVMEDSIYGLDGLGNRTNVNHMGAVNVYTMDKALPEPADFQMNQYTMTPFGGQVYDRNGNLISLATGGPSTQYGYDYANRLVSVDTSAGPGIIPLAQYAYDVFGRRISKTTFPPAPLAQVTTEFLYDGSRMIEERVGGRVTRSFYSPPQIGDEVLVSFNAAGETFYHLSDDLGNALALTDDQGNVLERYDYYDFGEPQFLNADGAPLTGADGFEVSESPAANPFLFHGMFWDPETRYYFGHSQGATAGLRWTQDPYAEDATRLHSRWAEDPYAEDAARRDSRWDQDPYPETSRTYDPKTGQHLSRVPDKISVQGVLQQSGRVFSGNNPWTGGTPSAMKTGTVKFFNDAKGFGRSGGNRVLVQGWDPKTKQAFASKLGSFAKGIAQVGLGVVSQRTTDVTGEIELPTGRLYSVTGQPTPVGEDYAGKYKLYSPTGAPTPAGYSVGGLEMFRKLLDRGDAGDNVGLLLRGHRDVGGYRAKHEAAMGSIRNIK